MALEQIGRIDTGNNVEHSLIVEFKIVNARTKPVEAKLLRELFTQHWKHDFELFKGATTIQPVPYPLLALDAGKLVGGLAYCNFATPNGNALELWINAVLVLPEYRGRGIASQLIQAAEQQVLVGTVQEIFALTEIPELYCKLNWKTLSSNKGDYVVSKSIAESSSQGGS